MGQAISSTQFYLYGRQHFTQTGYAKHMKKYTGPVQSSASIKVGDEGADGVSMDGRVVVITGANSGVGKELATYAAAKNAKVYMLCRSKERAEKARQEIVESTSNENINILLADLGELEEVRRVTSELQAKEDKVDVLVCNAGILCNDKRMTKEGNELTFALHLLGGTYLLSQLLIPQLEAAKETSRVIITTSGGMYNAKFPDWATATSSEGASHKYDGQFAYSYAKRGQVLYAEEMTKAKPDIKWVTTHPGWTMTPAVDDAYGDNKKYLEPMRTPWEGAEGIAWLMGAKKDDLEGGELYLDRKTSPKHLAGPAFSEGSFTKNSREEVNEMMTKLKEAAGL